MEGKQEEDEEDGFAAEGGRYPPRLRRAVESMVGSQHLLLRLLRVAEHGEAAVLRAKGFLALRLTLEAASPGLLLKACRSRLLPLLARAIGGLSPRSTARGPVTAAASGAGAVAGAGASVATAAAVPELSLQQEYLYECSTKLADWLAAVPGTAARRLVTELRKRYAATSTGSGGVTLMKQGRDDGQKHHQQCRGNSIACGGGGGSRRFTRQQAVAAAAAATTRTGGLEAAMATFPAVVHLVNSPLLRGRAVTAAFVSDLSGCLALSCPTAVAETKGKASPGAGTGARGKGGSGSSSSDRGAVSATAVKSWSGVDGGATGAVVLAAILPTVETLAQQAELVLTPHRETVSRELVPVLCRLLRSPSGDTRALVVAIFRVLLPPLVRQQQPGTPPVSLQHLDRSAGASVAGSSSPENMVRSAFAAHVLPLVADLLRDHAPIPQYTVRLVLDVGREWGGLGTALLADGGSAVASLLGRLPRPLLPGPLSSPPTPRVSPFTSPRSQARTLRSGHELAGDAASAATALDPALAALLTILVERDGLCPSDGGNEPGRELLLRGGQNVGYGGGRYDDSGSSSGGNSSGGIFVTLLHHDLPGRTAAAVVAAVEAGMPEATDALLGLAVVLLDAGLRRMTGVEHTGPASSAGLWEASRGLVTATAAGSGGGAIGGRRRGRVPERSSEKQQLEPLITAVPAAVEGIKLFCVEGAPGKKQRERDLQRTPTREYGGAGGGGALGVVDEGIRSGVADSATLFLEMCYKVTVGGWTVTCRRADRLCFSVGFRCVGCFGGCIC